LPTTAREAFCATTLLESENVNRAPDESHFPFFSSLCLVRLLSTWWDLNRHVAFASSVIWLNSVRWSMKIAYCVREIPGSGGWWKRSAVASTSTSTPHNRTFPHLNLKQSPQSSLRRSNPIQSTSINININIRTATRKSRHMQPLLLLPNKL
jgi:hypothetical protein